MTDIVALLERVRAATGPDRELSRDIWQALDTPEWKEAYLRAQEPCGCPHDQAVEYAIRYLSDVTASVDAALALVERVMPDLVIKFTRIADGSRLIQITEAWRAESGDCVVDDDAPLEPMPGALAILAALLAALSHKEPTP